jgi:hypothetical protein
MAASDSIRKPKRPVRGWRTYRSMAGKVVKEIQIANDSECPGVAIYFRDSTQFYIGVHPSIEFKPELGKLTRDDILVLRGYPTFKEIRR